MTKPKHENFSMLNLLLLTTLAVTSSQVLADEYDSGLPPEPQPGYYKYLEDCSKKIKPDCGSQVYGHMFKEEKLTVECCRDLVHGMGHDCHVDMVKTVSELPEVKGDITVKEAVGRSEETWNQCVELINEGSPAPSPS